MTPPAALLLQAKAAYERGRRRWALSRALPLALLPALPLLLGARPSGALGLGFALTLGFFLLLWMGRDFGKGAWAGLGAGLFALVLPLMAQVAGHACLGDGCYSLCIPACITGGLVAGFMVSRRCQSSASPAIALSSALGVAFLTGALGCSCVGYSGVLGLLAGLASGVSITTLAVRRA